ncbi:MAG TPA: antibiotic biosynthesis monooxygenase [Stenotrophomonas sp.]|jgi:quinol monooxygenase YgiN
MPDSALVFFVKLQLKPECIDEWLTALEELLRDMQREPTFVSCHLDRDAEDPTLYTLYEHWDEPSVDAFLAHQATDYRDRYEALLPGWLRTPRQAQVLLPQRQWTRQD